MSWIVSGLLHSFMELDCKLFLCYARRIQVRRNTASNSVGADIFIFELRRKLLT